MNTIDFENIFFDSFNTFKVFDDLDLQQVNNAITNTLKTVWEILNHLIICQQYDIAILTGQFIQHHINEKETWVKNATVKEQYLVDDAVKTFNDQINTIKLFISNLNLTTHDIQRKLKHIQNITIHLSFHLAEIILIRRQLKSYPLPDEMTAFLSA